MNKKKLVWIAIPICCIAVICAVLFLKKPQSDGDATIPTNLPKEVQTLVKDYLHAYMTGKLSVSVEYLHLEEESMKEVYTHSGDKLLDYKIERVEKINDNLYSLTILIKTELSLRYEGEDYQKAYNFVGKINGKWYYMNGVSNIPRELRENLDETDYGYPEDERMLPPEDDIYD